MFNGQSSHSIDEKGRLIIPSKFRNAVENTVVITKGLDGCLFGYTTETWKSLEEKLQKLPFANKAARQFQRFMLSSAEYVDVDKQGRVLLPQHLRTYAQLDKDVLILGVGSRFEIWDKDKYEGTTADENMDDIAEQMSDFFIDM